MRFSRPIVATDPDSPQSLAITEIAKQIAARIAVRNRTVLRVI
jgi:MinD-like ATPase involved in chromosome partitioning or flagellar assembly